jgi:hypothetical protein
MRMSSSETLQVSTPAGSSATPAVTPEAGTPAPVVSRPAPPPPPMDRAGRSRAIRPDQ